MLVTKRRFSTPELLLQNGSKITDVEIGYETYGTLNATGDNAIFITHYFSGTSHAAGRLSETDPEPGYWDTIIGPGKPIDTNRFFVVSSDVLCNLNAKMEHVITTGPASINPATGFPYGASFPVVSIGDFVSLQKCLCDHLGIKKLFAVAGPSMGALQAMEWSVRYPEFVDRVIAAIGCSLAADAYLIAQLDTWMAPIRLDPNFNDGEYYGRAEPIRGLTEALKLVTFNALHYRQISRQFQRRLASRDLDPATDLKNRFAVEVAIESTAQDRAKIADANSFLRLCRAVQLFSIRERKSRIRAPYLVIPAVTDLLMHPEYAEQGVKELRDAGVHVEVFEIEGDGGHLDGLNQIAQAADAIRRFLS